MLGYSYYLNVFFFQELIARFLLQIREGGAQTDRQRERERERERERWKEEKRKRGG